MNIIPDNAQRHVVPEDPAMCNDRLSPTVTGRAPSDHTPSGRTIPRPASAGAGGARAGVTVVVAALTLSLSACGGSADASGNISGTTASGAKTLSVVASTNVYGDIVKQIAGDKVEVTSIISDPAQDPHSYEADAITQLALSKADLVIENGGGYDDFVDTMLKTASNGSAQVINAVDLSGKQAPAGGELNEHVWYDFPTVARVATAVSAALSALAPANAALFERNTRAFTVKLADLEAQETAITSAHAGTGVAITEPVPLYLLTASGLVNKTPGEFSEAIEEGTDVPAAVLNQTLKLLRNGDVTVLAYNEQTAGPETEKVLTEAKADKVAVVPVTETLPDGQDYLSWMTSNLQALSAALGQRGR
jgi:zinc/manganese transport system substrate-binding protein